MKPVINIDLKVSFTKEQADAIKSVIWGNNCVQKACTYADIHFNTLKKAVKIKKNMHEIRAEQRDKILEFCELIQKQKSAA